MDIDEQFPVLLKIDVQSNQVLFRLDQNGLSSFTSDEKSVREISLANCIFEKTFINEIKNFVNEVFEYEVFQKRDKTIFQFWADYGSFESEIECESISEIFSEYTKEDLLQKGATLFNLYADLHKRFSENQAISYQMSEKLNFEIKNEIERSQRKSEFFENKENAKSAALQKEIKFLQKLQKILKTN